jgi:outer membrane protein OmpA-like peptidoglycan-associated protein
MRRRQLAALAPGFALALGATEIRAQTPREHPPTGGAPARPGAERATALVHPLVVIYFDVGSTAIASAARDELEAVARWHSEHPDHLLIVEGHASRAGSSRANERLSQQRAEAVRDQLVGLGADPRRLVTIGYGEREAAAAADESRRVVVRGTADGYSELARAQRPPAPDAERAERQAIDRER